jgi:FKBP-type peptidyl-prolyl cis-trans isomerase
MRREFSFLLPAKGRVMRVVANTIISFSLVLMVGFANAQPPAAPEAPAQQNTEIKPAQDQAPSDTPAQEEKPDEESVGSTKETASYVLGYIALAPLKQQKFEVDIEKFIEGVRAAYAGESLGMEREEVMSVQNAFRRNEQKRITELILIQTKANKEEGQTFMAEFAKQQDVQTIEDGVQYIVQKTGQGETAAETDEVKVHYEGKYVNGEVFDSSLKRGTPLQLGVSQFVPGFTAALKKMKVGDKWKVAIRGDRAYSSRPPGDMEPFKTLIFEVELLEVIEKSGDGG